MPRRPEKPGGSGQYGPKPSLLRVRVDRIRCHVRNPRRQPNPEHDRIRTSVRALGLDRPLVITRKPGARDYLLHGSGSTRLRILQELHKETGEERFRWADCIVRPWEGESGVLLAHLRDNELRAGLTFIERALAVFDAKALLERECRAGELSPKRLETLFRERGLGLGEVVISGMIYAVEVLWPAIPRALSAGLERDGVEEIRDLEHAAGEVWVSRGLDDDVAGKGNSRAVFDRVFAELCRRHDCPEWDIQPLRDALEREIAGESDKARAEIHLELEAALAAWLFPPAHSCSHPRHSGDGDGTRHPGPGWPQPEQARDGHEQE